MIGRGRGLRAGQRTPNAEVWSRAEEHHIATCPQDVEQHVGGQQNVEPPVRVVDIDSRVQELSTENNALTQKVSELSSDLIEKEMAINPISLHVQLLKEENRKLMSESENVRVERMETGSMSVRRSKQTGKGNRNVLKV